MGMATRARSASKKSSNGSIATAIAPDAARPLELHRSTRSLPIPCISAKRPARYDWTDLADRLGSVRHLPRWDDVTDRHFPERGHSSLLHMFDLRQQRQERV